MKRVWFVAVPALLVGVLFLARGPGLTAQQPAAATVAAAGARAGHRSRDSVRLVDRLPEVLARHELRRGARRGRQLEEPPGRAEPSGQPDAGPLYGNASTQLLEFDLATGRFVREIGKNVYGLGYGHAIRFDKYDNLWVVDKGTNAAVRFNPAGYVTMNLGRRPEGPDDPEESWFRNGRGGAPPPPSPGRLLSRSDRHRVRLRTTTCTSATATPTRASPSTTSTARG